MKKMEYTRRHFGIIIFAMVLAIAIGVALTVRMFLHYSELILENTDNQLISLARSVDLSAESELGRYTENLVHTLEHEECKKIEEDWLSGLAQDKEMQAVLAESLLGQDEKVTDVLVLKAGEPVLSLSGRLDYQLFEENDTVDDVIVRPCRGEDGTVYMAIVKERETGVCYGVLIELADFYEEITMNLSAELQNEIIMMDAGAKTLVYRRQQETVTDEIDSFTEADSKYSMLEFLMSQQKKGEEGTDFCDAVSSATGKAYTARMAVVPATGDTNGVLAIGVSTDYDEMTRPMRSGAVQLLMYGGMVFLGIVCLVILLMYTFRGSQRAMREVEILQKKNAAMEELNRQTQEFAHHQRLELMGTLTSGIAHEFNNLLAPIMGYSILVLEKLSPEENELYDEVLEIYNTSRKAKTVVSRLQDLARKNTDNDFQALEFDTVVRKVVEIANPAKPKPVTVELQLHAQGQHVMGNETQLSQLLLNLLLNAFHAVEEKGGQVTIHTMISDKNLLLRVEDNGYGITKEAMNRIFEPFFTTKKGGQGTGLGLAIAAQVVEAHHGTIQVESQKGEGTVFIVELPLLIKS